MKNCNQTFYFEILIGKLLGAGKSLSLNFEVFLHSLWNNGPGNFIKPEKSSNNIYHTGKGKSSYIKMRTNKTICVWSLSCQIHKTVASPLLSHRLLIWHNKINELLFFAVIVAI